MDRIRPKKNRAEHRSVKNDNRKQYNVGLLDIDETIIYYFSNVIQPTVVQSGRQINVPVLYGSPEKWKAVQKDGFYRDKNGKVQAPLIIYRRTDIEKNRSLGNKLDANVPNNIQVFEKKFSKKNVYDRFNILNNRIPVKEYQGVIIPDYVNIQYQCIIFTDYVEQMNKIVESINYASDAYWGRANSFRFRASIDSFTNNIEVTQGEDRKVKTEFTINLLGHIIPDTINAEINGPNKFFSKAAVNFKLETVSDLDKLMKRSKTPEREATPRFFDDGTVNYNRGMTSSQINYISLSNTVFADEIFNEDTAIYKNRTIVNPPTGFETSQELFSVFVNKTLIPVSQRIVLQDGPDIKVEFDTQKTGYTLDSSDEVVLVGKLI